MVVVVLLMCYGVIVIVVLLICCCYFVAVVMLLLLLLCCCCGLVVYVDLLLGCCLSCRHYCHCGGVVGFIVPLLLLLLFFNTHQKLADYCCIMSCVCYICVVHEHEAILNQNPACLTPLKIPHSPAFL